MITVGVVDPVATLSKLAGAMRERGVHVGPDRIAHAVASIAILGGDDLENVYWAGRASLCSDPAHIAIYDEVFHAHDRRNAVPDQLAAQVSSDRSEKVAGEERGETGSAIEIGAAASPHDMLGRRALNALSDSERTEILDLIATLRPRAERPALRRRSGGHARVDVDKTVDIMFRHGGELTEIARDCRRTKARRLVVLVDVSRSMSSYAEFLLRFGYAAVRAAPTTTEVFSLGTKLARLTRELQHPGPNTAFEAAASVIEDWHGGTRLGRSITGFLDGWGRRGSARGAVVVVCSDGQTDDPVDLERGIARLSRLAHTVIWANPYLGRDGYQPVAPGLRAVEPYVDFVPAGTLGALGRLAALIADPSSEPSAAGG